MNNDALLQGGSQLLETGALGVCMYFLLRWILTKQEEGAKKHTKAIAAVGASLVGLQKAFMAHDLTDTGIEGSENEACKLALKKYEGLQDSMNQVQQFFHDLGDNG